MAMFHLPKIRTSIDIFKNEKCKVTFGLEYIYKKNRSLYSERHVTFQYIKTLNCLIQHTSIICYHCCCGIVVIIVVVSMHGTRMMNNII